MYMPNGTDIKRIITAVMRLAWSGIMIDKIENKNRLFLLVSSSELSVQEISIYRI
jgi:hypothetical protein